MLPELLALVPVERIDAVGVSVVTKTEDIANARLAFKNGCVANLSASRVSLKKNREIRVFQTGGYLSIDFMGQKGHTVRVDPAAEGGFAKEEIPIEKGEPLAIELAYRDIRCLVVEQSNGSVEFPTTNLSI